jgi:uncharacterized membrane protein
MTRLLQRVSWTMLAVCIIGFVLFTVGPYLSLNPAVSKVPLNPTIPLHFPLLVVHATASGLALLLGPLQFFSRIRVNYPVVHRTLGRIYLTSTFLGALAGLFLAVVSTDPFVGRFGLGCLAVIWLASTYRAYTAIRQGHVQLHRLWVLRNFALTCAAIVFRLWMPIGLFLLHISFQEAYASAGWLSWIFPLLVAEWLFNQQWLQATILQAERLPSKH